MSQAVPGGQPAIELLAQAYNLSPGSLQLAFQAARARSLVGEAFFQPLLV